MIANDGAPPGTNAGTVGTMTVGDRSLRIRGVRVLHWLVSLGCHPDRCAGSAVPRLSSRALRGICSPSIVIPSVARDLQSLDCHPEHSEGSAVPRNYWGL
jgi:hypothetical protein